MHVDLEQKTMTVSPDTIHGGCIRLTAARPGASLSVGFSHLPSYVNRLGTAYSRFARRNRSCQASRRSYGSFSSSDWSTLFESLADLGRSFETASREYTYKKEAAETSPAVEFESEPSAKVGFNRQSTVPVDIEEDEEGYSLWMDVPGLRKADVRVEVFPVRRIITVSWERKRASPKADQDSAGREFRRKFERRIGKFSRTLSLAKDLDPKTIVAKVEKGVLHIYAKKYATSDNTSEQVEIDIN